MNLSATMCQHALSSELRRQSHCDTAASIRMLAGRGLLGRIPGGAIRRLSQATDCKIEAKVHALGLFIPDLSLLGGKFQPNRMVGGSTGRFVVYCAGSIPVDRANNPTYIGRVGADFDIAEGQAASQLAACGLLAQLKSACPNLEAVTACLKIGVYVNSTPDFTSFPEVADGASELMYDLFGETRGHHARTAVGVASLARGVAVEVDGYFEVMDHTLANNSLFDFPDARSLP